MSPDEGNRKKTFSNNLNWQRIVFLMSSFLSPTSSIHLTSTTLLPIIKNSNKFRFILLNSDFFSLTSLWIIWQGIMLIIFLLYNSFIVHVESSLICKLGLTFTIVKITSCWMSITSRIVFGLKKIILRWIFYPLKIACLQRVNMN